ncbi:DUF294 nucleotidyltransferase-like domain-containing protein [Oceanidesulfovibrio marinus]|uniref:Histidine kinase n=1 Tax=Oceanidesulfovibrio marinus TaxID=370038 RepID=A0A6P1ZE62_9BACT|nr:DUF294 nucleotidyltransferase-like domain-containing protein [Oceanidesulfovibrio marinus]TVM32508.1 histidine kinase [Oceanidesulfovibrio marinus]
MGIRDGNRSDPGAQPEMVLSFFRRTLPFSGLESRSLEMLASHARIDFLPSGSRFLIQGESEVEALYLVQKGGVRLYAKDETGRETLVDFRGEGGAVGGMALVQGGRARLSAETVEDTFFIKVPKETFLSIVEKHPQVARFYAKAFADEYTALAFEELKERSGALPEPGALYLMGSRVGQIMHGPPVDIPMGATIQQAAQLMERNRVGSVLVADPSGEHLGIVTDKDLRKTIAVGMPPEAPVEIIMSSPLGTVDERVTCFDALMTMMNRELHHLAVTRDGRVAGMITAHDIVVMQGKSPMALFREIMAQREIEGLYDHSHRTPQVIRALVEEGAKAGHITSMITVINDCLLGQVIKLLLKSLGPPPVAFCWMMMGSEGRREQTFKTDQDNAIIIRDVEDPVIARAAVVYFEAFTTRVIEHLVKAGFPPCPGGIMASNSKWRLTLSQWKETFERWILKPEPEEVMHAAIFFDFRAGPGQSAFAEELKRHLLPLIQRQEVFQRYLAANCLQARPPLSFFRGFIVEKNGEHKNKLDLKERGIAPIADFARVLALRLGIAETNTLARLEAVGEDGIVSRDLVSEVCEAYEFLMQLRLVHQLAQWERGEEPHNHVAPDILSELEKRTLKEAFHVIGRIQSFLKDLYKLNIA